MTQVPLLDLEPTPILRRNKRQQTRHSLNATVKTICDIMRRSNCAGALQYIPELTWILFLRIFDEQETQEQKRAAEAGRSFSPTLCAPYRWQDWAAPGSSLRGTRTTMQTAVKDFVNSRLLPYLHALADHPDSTARQRVLSSVVAATERVQIDTEANFLAVLDKVHTINQADIDPTHLFTLSQVYESLLLKMGEKGGDGGQFFTPREIVRVMVQVVAPQPGETVYDPCCGTGGFLAQAHEYIQEAASQTTTARPQPEEEPSLFFGREKENLIYPVALANLVLHGIDQPHIWHGNTLTAEAVYDGLFANAPTQFDVVLTNPPFGGKEGKAAQIRFPYKTAATQVLFLQHTICALKPGGRCAIVLDEGVLFRTSDAAFVQTKQFWLDTCDVWCIVSLPVGVFTTVGAAVKTNLAFFTKGQRTERIWYYDLSEVRVNKTTPLTRDQFADFSQHLPARANSGKSWTVNRQEIEARNYDLKAVNPHTVHQQNADKATSADILQRITVQQEEIKKALLALEIMRSS